MRDDLWGVWGVVVIGATLIWVIVLFISRVLKRRRDEAFRQWAEMKGGSFIDGEGLRFTLSNSGMFSGGDEEAPAWFPHEKPYFNAGFPLFKKGHSPSLSRMVSREGASSFFLYDFSYVIGVGRHRRTVSQTVFHFRRMGLSIPRIPRFSMEPKNIFHAIEKIFGMQDIDFPEQPGFSEKYLVQAQSEHDFRQFLPPACMSLLSGLALCVQGAGDQVIIYRHAWTTPSGSLELEFTEASRVAVALGFPTV